jgi:5-methylcytosine-specific restriction endonuclease McrA
MSPSKAISSLAARLWDYAPPRDQVNARRKAKRPYDHAERLEHERLITKHIAEHGHVCPACGLPTESLTVDHLQPFAQGGAAAGGQKRVVCDRCNKRRGARMQKRLRQAWGFRGLKGARCPR